MVVERWQETWAMLSPPGPPEILALLSSRYGESHREYHTMEHVLDCLEKADDSRALQRRPAAVDLALWFHDAVYDPHRSDNEERSAELATSRLGPFLPAETVALIGALILDTRHRAPPSSPDGAVVVDIDLSILGEDPVRFDRYRAAIRAEYARVPKFLYCRRRRRVLEGFLERDRIYATDFFHARYEEQARLNLAREIEEL